MEKEATIEEKIRLSKKEKANRRGEGNRRMEQCQPKRKRRRVEGSEMNEMIDTQYNQARPKPSIKIETPKKRKTGGKEDKKPAKKTRSNIGI
jgi:hypothetical protein